MNHPAGILTHDCNMLDIRALLIVIHEISITGVLRC